MKNRKKQDPLMALLKGDPAIEHEVKYVEFLRKRLASEHFRQNVSQEEFDKTKAKYDKAKLKLRMMQNEKAKRG